MNLADDHAPATVAPGVDETPLAFACADQTLWGIVSAPAAGVARSGCAVLIVVGGPQYRVGSHRQFVQLARALAAAGHVALRFDYRGMGDANGEARDFQDLDLDILAALAALRQCCPDVRRTLMWGLCDGASAALMLLQRQPQTLVDGLCLVNPWVRSTQTQAATQVKHYYAQRLLQGAFWRKLFAGGVSWRSLGELAGSARSMLARRDTGTGGATLGFQQRMALAWRHWRGPVLLLLSGDDFTAKEFMETVDKDPAWTGAWARAALERVDLPGADHTLSNPQHGDAAVSATLDWLARLPTLARP